MIVRWRSCAALVLGVAGQSLAQSRQGTVDVAITVTSDSAHIEERIVVSPSPSPLTLRLLTQPCATVENMRIERAGVALAPTQSRTGPWLTFRDTSASAGETVRLLVRYDARLAGTGAIPLAHLATAVSRSDSARLGPVSVTVRFADSAGRVEFPHMARQAPDEWSARYAAVPSFVKLAGMRSAHCDVGTRERGDNGGLVWRFFLLVGIMIAWVPLYLAWARRSSEADSA